MITPLMAAEPFGLRVPGRLTESCSRSRALRRRARAGLWWGGVMLPAGAIFTVNRRRMR